MNDQAKNRSQNTTRASRPNETSSTDAIQLGRAALAERQAIGPNLRAAREARGVSLEQLSAQLRLRVPILEALERGDFESLPEPIYTISYLRAYAQSVGLDPNPIVEAFTRANPKPSEAPAPRVQTRAYPPLVAIIAGTAIITALIAYLGFSLLRGQSGAPAQTRPARNTLTPRAPTMTPPTEPRTVALSVVSTPRGATVFLDGIRVGITPLSGAPVTAGLRRELKLELPGYQTETRLLDFERPRNLSVALRPAPKTTTTTPEAAPVASNAVVLTFTGSSWIRVIDDSGRVVFEGIPASDARLSFTPPVRVRAGRPDLVSVTIGTNTRKLGNSPNPTTVRFPTTP